MVSLRGHWSSANHIYVGPYDLVIYNWISLFENVMASLGFVQ